MYPCVEITELAGKAAGVDPQLVSSSELFEAALACEQARALLDATEGHVLAEIDARDACDAEFGLSTGTWLAREAMLPSFVAKKRVQVACMLRSHLGEVDEALVEGRISWDHARVLAEACLPRIEDAFAAIQAELVNLAEGTVFDRWKREITGIVELLDQDGGHDPNDDLARNKLTVTKTFDGVTHLAGTLIGDNALCVTQAIDAKADELYLKYSADRKVCKELPIPTRPVLRALALAELCRQAAAVDIDNTQGPRPDVTLVANASDPTSASDPQGVPLPDGTTRTLLCDPDLRALIVDSLGVPLDMGRKIRYANKHQRRAMARRDGGCVFTGCTAPAPWCDCHHINEYGHGGHTNIGVMACLCRHHHNVLHRPGWSMTPQVDGTFRFRAPSGFEFESQQHGRQPPDRQRSPA